MKRHAAKVALAVLSTSALVGLAGGDAIAAETVLLRYRGFGRAVPVADLATLAETGEAPASVSGLLRTANQDPAGLQDVLTRTLTVDPNLLSQALNSWPGELVLDQVGTAIRPPSDQANRQALRSALVLSAAEDGQITLLEVLERYPTREVVLEGDRIEDAYNQLASLLAPLSILKDTLGTIIGL
ncbi:alpha/beta hydrolase [Pseudanabaena sp. FACHB-2040]|uniref:alpha/beta hydrolase n=1 Tax=Pseudanabaena sp. FACHB-2040 TaxID=2692859 RepID=UPI001689667F|nr:alpha/beta hydrolase [Pseudanabaena sp. FACHB-2040]MBD2258179.1 alpha/beta hydrolase [Pseudanabaena sp. FACHB-2040]